MKPNEIQAERQALYDQGGLVLRKVLTPEIRPGTVSRMMPIDERDLDAWTRAARYNWLAAQPLES